MNRVRVPDIREQKRQNSLLSATNSNGRPTNCCQFLSEFGRHEAYLHRVLAEEDASWPAAQEPGSEFWHTLHSPSTHTADCAGGSQEGLRGLGQLYSSLFSGIFPGPQTTEAIDKTVTWSQVTHGPDDYRASVAKVIRILFLFSGLGRRLPESWFSQPLWTSKA